MLFQSGPLFFFRQQFPNLETVSISGKTWFPDLKTVANLVPIKLLILERGKNEAKGGILNVTIVFLVEK